MMQFVVTAILRNAPVLDYMCHAVSSMTFGGLFHVLLSSFIEICSDTVGPKSRIE